MILQAADFFGLMASPVLMASLVRVDSENICIYGINELKFNNQSQNRPVKGNVPLKLVVAAAVCVILVDGPVARGRPGVIFFTE